MHWLEIEQHLIKLGLEVHLYGFDDLMKISNGVVDHRKQFSSLGTIKHAADAGLVISTTTFLPLYMHHFVPCMVFIDPVDTVPINLQWRSNHNYMPINTQFSDYVEYVKNYISMWFMYNKGAEMLATGLVQELSKDMKGGAA